LHNNTKSRENDVHHGHEGGNFLLRMLYSKGRHSLRVGLHPSQLLDVARPAEEVVFQGVTALVGLVGELHLTTFADVTVDVKVFFHRHHSNRLLGPLDGSDGLVAGGALWREDPVKVVDAVDLVVEVDGEGDSVEALVAHAAPEAAGVVRLARTERGIVVQLEPWLLYHP